MKTISLSDYAYKYLDFMFCKAAKEYRLEFSPTDWDNLNNRLNQMEKTTKISRATMADKFIDLANEFTTSEPKERVGAAIMFAAARYNAFEASSKSSNLVRDKDDAVNWYTREYKRMLEANMDDLLNTSDKTTSNK
jgi:Protein of unknown function (DUF3144)